MLDPLEAFKTFKGRKHEPYCAISGTEFSSVTDVRQINILQFQNITQGGLNQRHKPKRVRSQIIQTLLRR